jgi:putative membrane protein
MSRFRSGTAWTGALWLGVLAYNALVVGFAWSAAPFAQGLAAIGIASALAHASYTYGWRHAAVLFLICVSITYAMENLGIATGFPFGRYHFEVARDLPYIGTAPLVVGPLWFGMGYFSWVVAGILLDGAHCRLDERFNAIALPVAAALVMTQWDLVLEPPSTTIARAWIWHDGGAFFGVPASNFFGWLLTTWLFYQGFALYLRGQPGALRRASYASRGIKAMAVLFYLCSGLTHVTPWLTGQSGQAADGAGHVWRIEDIREATVLIMLFTMGFTSLLALLRLYRLSRDTVGAPSGPQPS